MELDFTANGAGIMIHRFFEAVADYAEGRVPWRVLTDLFTSTDRLVDALKGRENAPVCELDAAGVAFREAAILWMDNHCEPKMPRPVYLEKHFAAEAKIRRRLEELHAAYVKISAAKGRKTETLSAANVLKTNGGESENRNRIFQEIDRLVGLGHPIFGAIKMMMSGTYAARMRGVKAETWRRYYNERCRKMKLKTQAQSGQMDETINPSRETINETINTPRETINETIKNLIIRYPGITGKDLVARVGRSRATVMRLVASLKKTDSIIYRGSKKTGGYFAADGRFLV